MVCYQIQCMEFILMVQKIKDFGDTFLQVLVLLWKNQVSWKAFCVGGKRPGSHVKFRCYSIAHARNLLN